MSMLLRSLLVLGVTGLLMAGCGKKEEAAPTEEAAPAPAAAVETTPAPAAAEPGGYVPTPDELVPGITIDPANLETAPAEEAPAE